LRRRRHDCEELADAHVDLEAVQHLPLVSNTALMFPSFITGTAASESEVKPSNPFTWNGSLFPGIWVVKLGQYCKGI
jgi:hypothetical protein